MSGVYGTKETSEAVVGALKVAALLIERFKDGVQFNDFTALYNAIKNDEEFKQALLLAYDGYKLIPDEVGELDLDDGFDLLTSILPAVKELINSIKPIPEIGDIPQDNTDQEH